MSGHAATAVRPRPPERGFWRVTCPAGCTFPPVASKEQAEWTAKEHRIRAVIASMDCTCDYDPEWMEYGPGWVPCPKHALTDALGDAA